MSTDHENHVLLTLPISAIARLRYLLTSIWFALGLLVILGLLIPYTCALNNTQCTNMLGTSWSQWLPLWSSASISDWGMFWHIALLLIATLLVKYMTLNLLRGLFHTELVLDQTKWYWHIPFLQLRFGSVYLNRITCIDIHGGNIDQLLTQTPQSVALRSGFANWPLLTCYPRDFELEHQGLHNLPALIVLKYPNLKLRFFQKQH